MNKRFTWMLAAVLLCGTMTVSAQKVEYTKNGKTVKRITFDREKVNIEYADNTKEYGVTETQIRRAGDATGINATKTATTTKSGWYTMDGRRLENAPKAKGVYVVKEGDKVRKTIKK